MVQPVNGIPVMCAWEPCSKPFLAFPSAVKRHAKLYCSRPCADLGNAQARTTRVTLICDYLPCSKPFEVHANTLKRGSKIRCCSRTCRSKLVGQQRFPGTFEDKFWAHVAVGGPDECWPWQGRSYRDGYGKIYVPETQTDMGTHIVSWFFAHGRWPLPGMEICHSCDRPLCVNDAHLWEGTQHDNIHDAMAKGRNPRGESHGNSKLTDAQFAEILALVAEGSLWHYEIAARYGISYSALKKRLFAHAQHQEAPMQQ